MLELHVIDRNNYYCRGPLLIFPFETAAAPAAAAGAGAAAEAATAGCRMAAGAVDGTPPLSAPPSYEMRARREREKKEL